MPISKITGSAIADDSITSARLDDGTIVAVDLASDAVTTAKIADDAVTTAKINAGAVDTTELADDAVTTAKILDGNVTVGKLSSSGTLPALDGSNLTGVIPADDAVTTAKIADDAVTTAKIPDDAVTTAKIVDDAVTEAHWGGNQLSHRNLIINGDMRVAQRGTQETGYNGSGTMPTCDRWRFDVSNLGTWTVDQSTDAPNGFSNSFKVTCTTADATPAADDYVLHRYKVEAQDLQQLGYGTSDAKDMTLSFWVKSNKTGVGTVEIQQEDNSSKRHNQNFTISSADTWEKKTMVIPADTSGAIDNDNGAGFQMIWWITTGSTWTTGSLSDSGWQSSMPSANRNAGGTLTVGTATSDYFAITGVQMEVGSVATPFEHRSYGEELRRCQRYYQASSETTGNLIFFQGDVTNTVSYATQNKLVTTMRAAPTVTVGSQVGLNQMNAPTISWQTTQSFRTIGQATSTSAGGYYYYQYEADAEL